MRCSRRSGLEDSEMARKLDRTDFTLAVMAAESGVTYEPVQVQKMFFLLDRNVADVIGGAYFNFQPYDYGPFDKAVYQELESLARKGGVLIESSSAWGRKRYALTPVGQQKGQKLLQKLDSSIQDYIKKVSKFVQRLSFAELVGAIYNAYPDMKVNSVFKSP